MVASFCSGTRDFSLAKRNTGSPRHVVSELLTRISSFASNDPFERQLVSAFGIESRTSPVRPRVSEVSTFFLLRVTPVLAVFSSLFLCYPQGEPHAVVATEPHPQHRLLQAHPLVAIPRGYAPHLFLP